MNLINAIHAIIDDDEAIDFAFRDLLIDDDLDSAADAALAYDNTRHRPYLIERLSILRFLLAHCDTETLTTLRLADSLCPMHAIDYAICFDDDDPECRSIRAIHPDHDT